MFAVVTEFALFKSYMY